MYIRKIFGFVFSLLCSLFQLKTEFQEITDFKKSYRELRAFPEPNRKILNAIEDELKNVQKNLLQECQICTDTYNILSVQFVLLKCGHEVCRDCFSHPRLRFCPDCREEKKEYKTKFDELTDQKKAQKKKHKKGKMRDENIMIEYESLKHVLENLTPKTTVKKLLQMEIKKYKARIDGQREPNLVVQKLQTVSKAIWKSQFGKKIKRMGRRFSTIFKLDTLDWEESLGTVHLWIQLSNAEKDHSNSYLVIIKLVVLKMFLYHAARKFLKYVPKNEINYSFQDPILNALFLFYDLWKTPKFWAKILFGFALFQQTKLSLMHNLGFLGVIAEYYFRILWEEAESALEVSASLTSVWIITYPVSFLLKLVEKHGFLYICKYFLFAFDIFYFGGKIFFTIFIQLVKYFVIALKLLLYLLEWSQNRN